MSRKGQPPIQRKKNLTPQQCWSFVNAALIAKDGSLTERINTYIAEHKELSEYAEQSEENRKILHWTIYRMALERCAYSLSRSLMEAVYTETGRVARRTGSREPVDYVF